MPVGSQSQTIRLYFLDDGTLKSIFTQSTEPVMQQIDRYVNAILQHKLGRHLTFWVLIYIVFTIAQSSFESQPYDIYTIILLNIPGLIAPIIASYFLNYYLIPRYFNSKRYLEFSILFILSAYFICVFARIINVHFAEALFRQGEFYQESIFEIATQFRHLITVYFPEIYFIAFAMAVLKQQTLAFEMKQRNMLLEKEKSQTELNFLKAQIHPHFLFNTLNNLYVLTLKKSDKAPDVVEKLSEILDYILYRGRDTAVPVAKEIKLLENYVSLEKLRYGDHLKISFRKEVDDPGTSIAPLLLLSLVENAFKHGASNQLTDPIIAIELTLLNQVLHFKVFNTKGETAATEDSSYRNGIGISNIRRQLALIYSEYSFDVKEEKKSYLVMLSIKLNKMRQGSA